MTEDTRKDKRAKIVSLNVRYKSATVDEFIENHSLDVSKGGIFIKTPTPFPPGTLIKFEIRIANDKAVIMGVGRVVWKREAAQSAGDRPSGMGVKFIKIDDSSRSVIDRVVAEKEGAGSAYATEAETGEGSIPGASRVPSDRKVATVPGVLRPGEVRKETIMGIGSATAAQNSSTNPEISLPPAGGGGMFPTSTSEPETGPVKEKTVMKQAAELLEEALKEAGGSMEEVGTNPLFAEGNRLQGRVGTAEQLSDKARKSTLVGIQAPTSQSAPAAAPAPTKDAPSEETPAATINDAPEPPPAKFASSPPPATRESPSDKVVVSEPAPKPALRTDPPAARKPAPAVLPPEDDFTRPKKSAGMLWVVGILVVAGGVAFVYKDNLLGGGEPAPTATTPVVTPPPPPATAPTVSAAPTPAPSAASPALAAPSATASASASPSASATPTPSASATPAATSVRPSVSPTATTPNGAPRPTATPTATAAPTATPAPKPTATAKPTPAPATATPAATDTPAPKPKAKPKATAAPDDNPY